MDLIPMVILVAAGFLAGATIALGGILIVGQRRAVRAVCAIESRRG